MRKILFGSAVALSLLSGAALAGDTQTASTNAAAETTATMDQNVTSTEAKGIVKTWLDQQGKKFVRVGEAERRGDTYTVTVRTVEGSVVGKIKVDARTGKVSS